MPVRKVDDKDPNEVKVYTLDWTDGLNASATISTQAWTVPSGITKSAEGIVTGSLKTSITLSGGTDGTDYSLLNRVTTSDGETLDWTVTVKVRSR